jgi:hypothetical protein
LDTFEATRSSFYVKEPWPTLKQIYTRRPAGYGSRCYKRAPSGIDFRMDFRMLPDHYPPPVVYSSWTRPFQMIDWSTTGSSVKGLSHVPRLVYTMKLARYGLHYFKRIMNDYSG